MLLKVQKKGIKKMKIGENDEKKNKIIAKKNENENLKKMLKKRQENLSEIEKNIENNKDDEDIKKMIEKKYKNEYSLNFKLP